MESIQDYIKHIADESERPLDRMVTDGGFCGIFRTIGCVGDSLSSGEFESYEADGTRRCIDMYDYSWGQYLARMAGCKVYNFSRGGMTAKWYMDTYADEQDFWNPEKACQAYIIALGVNDLIYQKFEVGTTADINLEDWHQNTHNFAGYYAMIVQRLKEISPDAKFFFVTMPRQDDDTPEHAARRKAHADLMHAFAGFFSNSYVIDLYTYAPVYDAAFGDRFFMETHMDACGYLLTARMMASYIDYIIRHNPDDFHNIGFVCTPYIRLKTRAQLKALQDAKSE